MADDTPPPKDTGKPDDILAEAKEAFALCEEREADNRKAALADMEFGLLDKQWPDAIQRQRETDGRPCLTTNLLKPLAKQVKNDARQNRPQIKIHPVDDQADVHTATLINGLIRNIEATSKADQAYDIALASAVDGGWGYFRINTAFADDDSFDLDLRIESVPNPFSIWGDPYSTAPDSSDWNTAFVAELMPRKRFEETYKGAEAVNWDAGAYSGLTAPWQEGDQVLVAEWWTREKSMRQILLLSDKSVVGEDVYAQAKELFDAAGITVVGKRPVESHRVRQRILTGAEVLEQRDWKGRYIPIIPVYGDEVNIEGKRHFRSFIASAKDAQVKYNAWDSAATEMAAYAPKVGFVGAKGQFVTDAAKWASANSEAWGYMEYDMVAGAPPPQRPQVDFASAAAALQTAAAAANDIKAVVGVHEPGVGEPVDGDQSGRALLQLQRRSDTSTFNQVDNLSRSIEHGGRVLIDLIPPVYSGDRIVRVMGSNGERLPPVQLGTPTPVMDAKGRPVADDQGQAVLKVYDLSVGKYDLDVKAGPSFATQRQEAASGILALVEAFPQAGTVLGDILAQLQDWPDADEVATRLKALLPPELKGDDPRIKQLTDALTAAQQQGAQAQQQLADQLRQAVAQVEDMQVRLDAEKAKQDTERRKLQIAAFEAETDRLKVISPKTGLGGLDPTQAAQFTAQAIANAIATPDIIPGVSGQPVNPQVGLNGQPLLPPPPIMPPGGPLSGLTQGQA